MNYPQIVGLKCWYCNKTISSITEGRFCSSCCNPIHLTCTLPGRTAVPEGRCAECGADPQSPLALEVKAEIQKRATDPQIICPSCGSTHGFGPFRTDSSPDPNVRIFGALPYLLMWIMVAGANSGECSASNANTSFGRAAVVLNRMYGRAPFGFSCHRGPNNLSIKRGRLEVVTHSTPEQPNGLGGREVVMGRTRRFYGDDGNV